MNFVIRIFQTFLITDILFLLFMNFFFLFKTNTIYIIELEDKPVTEILHKINLPLHNFVLRLSTEPENFTDSQSKVNNVYLLKLSHTMFVYFKVKSMLN